MKIHGTLAAVIVGVAVGLGAGSTWHPRPIHAADPPARSAPTASGLSLLGQVTALQQINSLGLTAGQVNDIEHRLVQLKGAELAYQRKANAALRPVQRPLLQAQAALVRGNPPTAAVQQAIRRVSGPLQSDYAAVAQLRQSTVDAIRQDLTRAQLDEIRVSLGIAPVGETDLAPLMNGPEPGAAWYGPEPGASTAVANQILQVLDNARALPIVTYNQQEPAMASQLAAAIGAIPGTPYFEVVAQNMRDLMNQARTVSIGEYQAERQQVAMEMVSAAQNEAAARAQTLEQAIAAAVDMDDQATGTFFVQDDMLAALQAKVRKA